MYSLRRKDGEKDGDGLSPTFKGDDGCGGTIACDSDAMRLL